MKEKNTPKGIDDLIATNTKLIELSGYQDNSVVSRTIIDKKSGTITFFAFDEGQSLSEHTVPFDAFVYIIDGDAKITISGKSINLTKGEMIIMPANQPHAVRAINKFKMILVLIK